MPLTRYLPFMPGSHPVVAVVPLKGAIADLGRGRRGLNLAAVATHLERAFRTKRNKAVALAINSPGGSPVQSALIHRRIRDLAQETEKPVFAFCEDAAASGGYWLAAAGDEIFADACSIVGSIGVVSSGFGFTEAIAKLGVERRVYTAGDKKVIL
ncbi:MAG: S49 family peptidase, partial [Rhodospirillales bacterium]